MINFNRTLKLAKFLQAHGHSHVNIIQLKIYIEQHRSFKIYEITVDFNYVDWKIIIKAASSAALTNNGTQKSF